MGQNTTRSSPRNSLKNHKQNGWKISCTKKNLPNLEIKVTRLQVQPIRVVYQFQSKSSKSKGLKIKPSFEKLGFYQKSHQKDGKERSLTLLKLKSSWEKLRLKAWAPNTSSLHVLASLQVLGASFNGGEEEEDEAKIREELEKKIHEKWEKAHLSHSLALSQSQMRGWRV